MALNLEFEQVEPLVVERLQRAQDFVAPRHVENQAFDAGGLGADVVYVRLLDGLAVEFGVLDLGEIYGLLAHAIVADFRPNNDMLRQNELSLRL